MPKTLEFASYGDGCSAVIVRDCKPDAAKPWEHGPLYAVKDDLTVPVRDLNRFLKSPLSK